MIESDTGAEAGFAGGGGEEIGGGRTQKCFA